MIECMVIESCIVAIDKVYAIVSSAIAVVIYRYAEVEVVAI